MTVPDSENGPARKVTVQVGASPSELPPLRTVAADLAVRADFDLDTVADLRMAVDEAAAELVGTALPGATLTCTFDLLEDRLHARISVPADESSTVATNSFGWRVLTTLVDEVRVQHDRDGDRPVLAITLQMQRRTDTQAAVGR